MKKLTIVGTLFVVSNLAFTPAMAADRNVTIVNETGYAMVEFYGSNKGTSSWEEDLLGEYVLGHGERLNVNFDDGTGHCMFDFLAVFEDGDRVTQPDVDVCQVGMFTFE